MTPELLAIIGGFVALGLSVNAYFIKQLVDSLNQVKIQTAILLERDSGKEKRLGAIEHNQREIFIRLNDLERK